MGHLYIPPMTVYIDTPHTYILTCLEYVHTYTYGTVAIYSVTCASKVEYCMLVSGLHGACEFVVLEHWHF